MMLAFARVLLRMERSKGRNLEDQSGKLAGERWWLKRSLQIEMIDLRENWRELVNHGGLSDRMLSSCLRCF